MHKIECIPVLRRGETFIGAKNLHKVFFIFETGLPSNFLYGQIGAVQQYFGVVNAQGINVGCKTGARAQFEHARKIVCIVAETFGQFCYAQLLTAVHSHIFQYVFKGAVGMNLHKQFV